MKLKSRVRNALLPKRLPIACLQTIRYKTLWSLSELISILVYKYN